MAVKDVVMTYVEDDIKKIQTKTNLYLQSYGEQGAKHLVQEVVQNAVDEGLDENSQCDETEITLDLLEDSITVEDNGRGIPETDYPMDISCTKIQSGSKFTRDQGTASAGEFGVGLTCVNALSTSFILTNYREKEKYIHRIEFREGEKISDTKEPQKKGGKKHGVIVKFIPSKKYLGKSTKLPCDDIMEWIDKISYDFPENYKIRFIVTEGLTKVKEKIYKAKDSIGLLNAISNDKFLIKPIKLEKSGNFIETTLVDERGRSRNYSLTLMFCYDDNMETIYDSYCNFANTTEGGVHLDAAETALCRYLQKKTKDAMSEKEKEKMDILWNDIRSNLKMVIQFKTNANVQFVGNAKKKVAADQLTPIIMDSVTELLTDYFEGTTEKDTRLKQLVKVIKLNAKARIESSKIKASTTKESMNYLKEYTIKNYTPPTGRGNSYREILMVEGDSAGGCANQARDPETQGVFAFRGVVANPLKRSLSDLMHPVTGNAEWRNFVKVSRMGIGPTFNLSKSYFDKYIIMTDADIDGHGIAEGMCLFFLYLMPEVVENGMLYRAVTPLYKLRRNGKTRFAITKEELVGLYQNDIIKNYNAAFVGWDPKQNISKNEFKEFIYDTDEYPEMLTHLAKHFKVNKRMIERVCAFLVYKFPDIHIDFNIEEYFDNQEFIKDFMEMLQKSFPELTLNGNCVRGIIDYKYQSMYINNRFIRKVSTLFDIYRQYGYSLIVDDKKQKTQMSISEFIDTSSKYRYEILQRFKGLGELDSDDLWETTLNPNTRTLIQLTTDDLEKELDTFHKLNGPGSKDAKRRKDMMKGYRIKLSDLDN